VARRYLGEMEVLKASTDLGSSDGSLSI